MVGVAAGGAREDRGPKGNEDLVAHTTLLNPNSSGA